MEEEQKAIEELLPRSLFGGAMSMGMPARFVSVDAFRPVPDNQEVPLCVAECVV